MLSPKAAPIGANGVRFEWIYHNRANVLILEIFEFTISYKVSSNLFAFLTFNCHFDL
jgi:hypothetical protein